MSYPAGTVTSVHEHLINLLPYEEADGWAELAAETGDSAQAEGGSDGGGKSAWEEKARAVGGSAKERQLARLLPVLFLVSSSLMPTARRYPLLLRDRRLLHHVRIGLFGVDLAALSIPLDATSAYSTSAAARPHLFFAKKLYLPLHPDSLCGFAASPRPRSPDPLWRTLRAHHLLPPNGLPILNPNWVPRLPNQHLNQQARAHMVVGEALRRDWVVVVSLVWSVHGGREGQGVAGGEDIGLGEGELAEGGAGGGEGAEGDNKEAADAMNRVIVMMRELFGEARVVVYDEHVPLLQAKELFSRAILFVGPTSPALSNLIFMPFNSTLIEVLPRTVAMAAASIPVVGQQRAATWHFHLASRLGIHHFLSACDPTKVNWHSQEHCHVDEVYGTVTAMIRNNPTLHAFTGLPSVSFPPDEPASFGDFRSRIPGSRLKPGTGEAAAFKQWMSCVAERGEWRYNATPRVLPWEEKQVQSCDSRHMKQGGVAGVHADKIANSGWDPAAAAAAWKVRESLKYQWVVPREKCAGVVGGRQAVVGREGVQGEIFSRFDGRALCELAARRKDGLRIAFIGDSLTREHHYSFMNNIIKHIPKPAVGTIVKRKCLEWIDDTVTVTCAGYRIEGCPKLEIHYVATTRLMRVQEEKLERAAWLHVPWQQVPGIRNSHVLIMNRGAHYKPAVKVVKAVRRIFRFLRHNHPDKLLIYRTTPPGHLNCLNHTRPITERQDGTALPFRWGEFKQQNEMVREIVEDAGGLFMDVDPMMALRPDGHRGVVAKDKVDCLHYCLPGPEDTWSEFLYNIIQRLVPVQCLLMGFRINSASGNVQPISTSPVATWRGGGGSHLAKFPHTFLPPPAVPPSTEFAFVPRFTALRGEWPSPSPPPATPPSAHAVARRGKEGGGSRRRSWGKGRLAGGEGAAAGTARGEGGEALDADEEAYMEDGAWDKGRREDDAETGVNTDSGRHGTRMLVVQPRPHPRWLLRAKLGEALRLVDSLTGTDSQWEVEQRSWGGAGAGEDAQAAWRGGQEPQQGRGGAREWQGGGEQWRQGEDPEAEWRRRSEGRGMRGDGVEGRGRSGDGVEGRGRSGDEVEGFGFPLPGGGHPWVVVHSRGRGIHAGSFFGSGTIESIAAHVHASHTMGVPVEAVFVNAALSGVQQRNLEAAWGLSVVDRVGLIIEILGARANSGPFTSILPLAPLFLPPLSPPAPLKAAWGLPVVDRAAWGLPVVDRVGLIIEIFGARANTREAKLQVEMAGLEYQRSRLVRQRGSGGCRLGFGSGGEQQVVSARGRAAGGRGFLAGAGESELQLQRRRIAEKQHKLRQQIAQVRRTRGLHRLARRRACWEGGGKGRGLPVVAVVGYTNAGKSTLVTALSQSPQYIDDRRRVLLSDTVGFISDLPHQLVEAFHATLEEVVEADLLLHVVDASAPDMHQQRQAVLQVLTQMGVPVDPGMAADLERGEVLYSSTHHRSLEQGGPPPSLAPPALRLVHSRVTSA
ncbi:unnamed protein product [Closterium sp. NIES-65]|nr:unnamed protein product [Closterium sp. NIES-65]